MWAILQDQSVLVGAVLVAVFHAHKFSELNAGNPVTGRYLALLPGVKVRDFTGPYAYHIALAAFLSVSLIAYLLVCQLSPNILQGALKLLGNGAADKVMEGVPYPLYVAILFIGLTQPIVPVFSRFGDVQRDFFHDQIEVPRRVIDLADRLTGAIEARANADKRQLAKEARNLAGGDVLSIVQADGDLAFYKFQLEKLDIGDAGAFDKAIKEGSPRELRAMIERLVLCTLVAVMRKSGTKSLAKVAQAIGAPTPIPRLYNLGYLITGITASGLLFSVCILTIAHVFTLLAGPVADLFDRSPDQSLWPNDLDNVGYELWTIVPPIFICLIVAVSLLAPREQADGREAEPPAPPSSDFVGFFRSGASVLGLCIIISILVKIAQLFYEYGTFNLPKEALSSARLMLPLIQSFIPVAVCLLTTWYLASNTRGAAGRGPSFTRMLGIVAVAAAFLAVLYDLTFLHQYLRVRPQDAPGWEHLLFSVVANALISICAFVSVVLFFRSRTILQRPAEASQVPPGIVTDRGEHAPGDFAGPRHHLHGNHRHHTDRQNGWDVHQAT